MSQGPYEHMIAEQLAELTPLDLARTQLLGLANKIELQPSMWCQKSFARNEQGMPFVKADQATSWCIHGLIYRTKALLDNQEPIKLLLLKAIPRDSKKQSIVEYNDSLPNVREFVAWLRFAASIITI